MATNIRVLDDILADQIAAGEVVERPASVVKELVENAVDAGASKIHVAMEEGGQALIRVADDGCGMGPEDAILCVRRHATSKLRQQADLFAIQTLGFRGEALPSIASVSRFSLTTRPKTESAGTRVRIEGGHSLGHEPVGCAPGTIVEVRDLFYNVPARRKFLKAKATESGHISGVCARVGLAYPELHLTLTRDGRPVREFLPGATFPQRVGELFPGEQLTTLELALDGMQVQAVLGAPERARNGALALHCFVNGRPVRDITLARAVAFAYGSVLPPGRFPVGGLNLRLPADEIDVNVHPQKSEVRFRDGRTRFDALTRALAKQLGTSAFRGPAARPKDYWKERLGPGPRVSDNATDPTTPETAATPDLFRHATERATLLPQAQPGSPPPTASTHPSPADPWLIAGTQRPQRASNQAQVSRTSPETNQEAARPEKPHTHARPSFFSNMRFLAQVRRMLLICEGDSGLYVIDQHAADERVRYDRYRRAYHSNQVKTQRLLFPERVECTEQEIALIAEQQELLSRVGLECAALGETTAAIHAVPALLRRASPAQLLRDLLTEIQGTAERAFGDAVDMALATMACHAAIRAGDLLSPEEANALLKSLDEVEDFGGHCPHGRPVAFDISFADLERRLGR